MHFSSRNLFSEIIFPFLYAIFRKLYRGIQPRQLNALSMIIT